MSPSQNKSEVSQPLLLSHSYGSSWINGRNKSYTEAKEDETKGLKVDVSDVGEEEMNYFELSVYCLVYLVIIYVLSNKD